VTLKGLVETTSTEKDLRTKLLRPSGSSSSSATLLGKFARGVLMSFSISTLKAMTRGQKDGLCMFNHTDCAESVEWTTEETNFWPNLR
jgi:hypothetical protein